MLQAVLDCSGMLHIAQTLCKRQNSEQPADHFDLQNILVHVFMYVRLCQRGQTHHAGCTWLCCLVHKPCAGSETTTAC